MKVINLISISLLSLGIFGNNSSWSMNEIKKYNMSQRQNNVSAFRDQNEIILDENMKDKSDNNDDNSKIKGELVSGQIDTPYNGLWLNLDNINPVNPKETKGIDEYANSSLSKKMEIINKVNEMVEKSDEYKNIDKSICDNEEKNAVKVIENLEKELESVLKNNTNKDYLIRYILIELGYHLSTLQFENVGFLTGKTLDVNINDNIDAGENVQ